MGTGMNVQTDTLMSLENVEVQIRLEDAQYVMLKLEGRIIDLILKIGCHHLLVAKDQHGILITLKTI